MMLFQRKTLTECMLSQVNIGGVSSKVYLGNTLADKAYLGTDQVWSAFNPLFTDDFNRADALTTLGPDYDAHDGVLGVKDNGTCPVDVVKWCYVTLKNPCVSSNVDSSVVLGPITSGPYDHLLFLSGVSSSGDGLFGYLYSQTASFYRQTGWSAYNAVRISIPMAYNAGDKITFRRSGTLYSFLRNDVATGIEEDYPASAPDTNHRLAGFGVYQQSPGQYRIVDSFSAYPLEAP